MVKWAIIGSLVGVLAAGFLWTRKMERQRLDQLAEVAEMNGWDLLQTETYLLKKGVPAWACRAMRGKLRKRLEGPGPTLLQVIQGGKA
jgi:hypothetical protein